MINFKDIFSFLKSTSPVSIVINVVIGVVLFVVGGYFLTRKKEKPNKKAGSICVGLAILFFLGAISNWAFSTNVF